MFDGQVLSFDAFFLEAVTERASEQYRAHRCKLLFYLEDDSMQLVEPRMVNAGLPQGLLAYLLILCLMCNPVLPCIHDVFSNVCRIQ